MQFVPLFHVLVLCLVGVFDRLNRLYVFGNIFGRQAVFHGAFDYKVLVPAIGFKAIVDVVAVGEIGEDFPSAAFVIDDRDHGVLVAVADAFSLVQPGTLGRIEAEQDSNHAIVVATGEGVALSGLVFAALMEAKRMARQGSNAEWRATRHALSQPGG